MTITIKTDNLKKMLASLHRLEKQSVLIGIPGADFGRKPDPGEAPITNAEIGYKMEFGSPAEKIPPRPTLIPGITAELPKLEKRLRSAASAAVVGDDKEIDRQLEAVGIEGQIAVKKMINSNVPPKLSDTTIAKRLAKGRTGTRTLVDTAQFRESVTYIRRGK
jgi:hypothetical protein